MQASEGTLKLALGSKSPMQESFGPPKIKINFANDGVTTKKNYVLQKILTLG